MVNKYSDALDNPGAAPFNSALDTLLRISKILIAITENAADMNIRLEDAQFKFIQLTKMFYINSAPLLNKSVVDKYKYVLQIEPKKVNIINKKRTGETYLKETRFIYSKELDLQLQTILVGIQQELQKENYFMPPKYDISSGYNQE